MRHAIAATATAAAAATLVPLAPLALASPAMAKQQPYRPHQIMVNTTMAGPLQSERAYVLGHHRGMVTYTNWEYAEPGSGVWNFAKAAQLRFLSQSTAYDHTIGRLAVRPLGPRAEAVFARGHYGADPNCTWVLRGFSYGPAFVAQIRYTGTVNHGYVVNLRAYVHPDGSLSGGAKASDGQYLRVLMPAGSAFEVLNYRAPVSSADVGRGGNAWFIFTIPQSEPQGLAGLRILVKVHDGRPAPDSYAHGVYPSAAPYPITGGDILVRR